MKYQFDFSIRTILVSITGFLGMLALMLTLISGEIHTQHFFNHQHLSMQKMIRLKTNDLLSDLEKKSSVLGSGLQASTNFQQAFSNKDTSQLIELMRNRFNDYFVTAGLLKLEQLAVFDASFSSVAEENNDSNNFTSIKSACPEIVSQANQRVGPDRMKLLTGLCLHDGLPFHITVLPMGGLRLKGYLAVTTDPTHNLALIEPALGVPLSIQSSGGKILYKSAHWPKKELIGSSFLSNYELKLNGSTHDFISLEVADDIRPLYGNLPQTRMTVMVAAALVTLLCIFLVMRILNITTLTPLHALADHLRQLRTKEKVLGEKVHVSGTKEIRELSTSFNDMTEELGKLQGALEDMAFTDQLTTLPNRNGFQSQLQQYLVMNKPFALFIMDMNNFKTVNDTLGHHVGDMLLIEVSARLDKVLRSSDVVIRLDEENVSGLDRQFLARLGGDEFSAILPEISTPAHAEIAAGKIIKAMEEPFYIEGHKLLGGISTGIALFPLHANNHYDLMIKSDVAMYHAKKTNQGFAIYDDQFNTNSLRHLTLDRDLHNAIKHEQLLLNYQPKINFQTGQVCGTEALVRWRHPDLGIIPPDEFISIAEKSGLIRQLTAWVINRALQDCNLWRAQGHDIGVSVNISALNLSDRNLCEDIQALLVQWSIQPSHLILELTESAMMSNPADALNVLEKLHAMGIGLSIDDFGTGYSSLTYIKKLPVSEIKIDKSFVHEMNENNGDEAIIRSVVVLAHYLKLSVVAEGVEDETTYDYLKEVGCSIAQGYYIAKPMPAVEYFKWLESNRWKRTSI